MLKLIVFEGPGRGREVELTSAQPEMIGREAPRLRVVEKWVSRRHAEIRIDDGRWLIRDIGSSNGTFVNDARIVGPTELHEGDKIRMGRALLVVSHVAAPSNQDPHSRKPDEGRTPSSPSETQTTQEEPPDQVPAQVLSEAKAMPSRSPAGRRTRALPIAWVATIVLIGAGAVGFWVLAGGHELPGFFTTPDAAQEHPAPFEVRAVLLEPAPTTPDPPPPDPGPPNALGSNHHVQGTAPWQSNPVATKQRLDSANTAAKQWLAPAPDIGPEESELADGPKLVGATVLSGRIERLSARPAQSLTQTSNSKVDLLPGAEPQPMDVSSVSQVFGNVSDSVADLIPALAAPTHAAAKVQSPPTGGQFLSTWGYSSAEVTATGLPKAPIAAEIPPQRNGALTAKSTRPPVVFLVDASGSLLDTLPQLVEWLNRSLDRLEPTQRFTVIFFREGEAIEVPPAGLKGASRETNRAVRRWMDPTQVRIHPRGRSDPLKAVQLALSYDIEEMVILSDDSISRRLGPEEISDLLGRIEQLIGDRPLRISAVQFFYKDQPGVLASIADRYGGDYEFVIPEPPVKPGPLEFGQE